MKKQVKEQKKIKENRTSTKKEKKNIFKSIGNYFKGVGKEISRIRWTGLKDLFKYSLATVIFIVFIGVYFYLIDIAIAFVRSML